jgi:hypothetical protein
VAHLVGVAAWLGGIVLLAVTLRRPGDVQEALRATERFARIALPAIGLVVLSGAVQAWRQLERGSALWDTDYGRLLIAKILVVVSIVIVASATRDLLRHRISRACAPAPDAVVCRRPTRATSRSSAPRPGGSALPRSCRSLRDRRQRAETRTRPQGESAVRSPEPGTVVSTWGAAAPRQPRGLSASEARPGRLPRRRRHLGSGSVGSSSVGVARSDPTAGRRHGSIRPDAAHGVAPTGAPRSRQHCSTAGRARWRAAATTLELGNAGGARPATARTAYQGTACAAACLTGRGMSAPTAPQSRAGSSALGSGGAIPS